MPNTIKTLIIKNNASWLAKKPRSTWEVTMHLFPGMIHRVKDVPEAAEEVADLLFEEGYMPINGKTNLSWDLAWVKIASHQLGR